MAARGDDRVQVHPALHATATICPTVDVQAGVAECPGDGIAGVEAGCVLPGDPIQDPPVTIK
ncbi:hypothetical protein D3C80_2228380 [compost metagenome]